MMRNRNLFHIITTGITLIILLSLSTTVKAETFCSYAGPDISKDLMRLTDFSVSGPSPLKEGNTITVKFKLQNLNKFDVWLGAKGIFAASRDPNNLDTSFGFTRANTALKAGETVSIEVSRVLDKAGVWKIWPSYHLFGEEGEKFGPHEWHLCSLKVSAVPKDSDKDGIPDEKDNCPKVYNPDQKNRDGDAFGDACDDSDKDGVMDDKDNCIFVYNPDQKDADKDGIGDACELVVDSDKDGIPDDKDKCIHRPETFNNYQDEDGCPDEVPKVDEVPEVKDKIPPIVTISHSPRQVTTTSIVTFTAIAQDNTAVAKIIIYVAGSVVKECTPPDSVQGNWRCIYTGGPYRAGTLTYKAEAFDLEGNKGISAEGRILISAPVITPPGERDEIRVVPFCEISGRISRFPYDFATLKIKICEVEPPRTSCLPRTERFVDALHRESEEGTYRITLPCEKTYLIEPVYQAVRGLRGKCEWRGSWRPSHHIVTLIEGSRVSDINFEFSSWERDRPEVQIFYTSDVSRESGIISDNDRITFRVRGVDRGYGVAKIQILQRLDDGIFQEILKECNTPHFPHFTTCTFVGGPYPGVKKITIEGVVCDRAGNMGSKEISISLTAAHCLNNIKDADEQDIDCGGADCKPCPPTCGDGIRNRDETGIDCGGEYCPPCSRCQTGAKWAPHDTPCRRHWPTNEGPRITGNTTSDSCELYEVCHPELDYIIQDAITCCEYSDFERRFSGHRAECKKAACRYARGTSGIDINYNPVSFKKCLGIYAINGFGAAAVYMQGYFYGEMCCFGSKFCPRECPKWKVRPRAWEMGTAASCAGPGGAKPDFQMGGHRCIYRDWGLFNTGMHGWWNSDTDYTANNDSLADVPAHASINRLSTGTCVDYSVALTTILRKLGYSKDEVFSVEGREHWYNLVKFPGETKWNYVDTVGNRGGEIFGGISPSQIYDSAGKKSAWYDYCKNMTGGCSNDSYGKSRNRCPPNNIIYTCETIPR